MNIRRMSVATKRVRAAEFDEQADFVIPEDLSGLSVEELANLEQEAIEHARALGEQERTPEVREALTAIRDGVNALRTEQTARAEAAAEADETVESLLAEIVPVEDEPEAETTAETEDEPEAETEDEPEALAAGATRRGETRIAPGLLRRRTPDRQEDAPATPTIADYAYAAADVSGFAAGQALDYDGMAQAVIARLKGYNHQAYAAAAAQKRVMRNEFGTFMISKPVQDDLIVSETDSVERISQVFEHATSESRLPEGTLLASGGWCAPSETLYDLYDMGESTDGMVSLPEVTVRRGGIRYTVPTDFSSVFSNIGWDYTEQDDIDGDYDGAGGGEKPCFRVDCPDFQESRLGVVGLCIQAGLLQRVGYPETIAYDIRKGLVAHAHRLNAKKINALVAGSTPVSMAATQQGATAPILDAIEKQVEHYRYSHLLNHNTTLEAVFPLWIHGAIRSDLSRRLGLAEFDVPDARINGWFAQRGVRAQFVYDWQSIASTGASGFNAWPQNVSFLLYKAGTWVVGGADILTVNTMYDSTLLGQNDFTALWTEEGMLVAKKGIDSRVVTTSIVADGATHVGVDISRTGV